MANKQRQVRVEQRGAIAAIQALEDRSDEELAMETKQRAAAQAILGQRAAERYDAKAAREHFRRAIAASRPQERMQLRRQAEVSLAFADRRADDLKSAVEKLGQEAPSSRQLFALKLMRVISPPEGASTLLRVRGGMLAAAIIIGLLLAGLAVVEIINLPFGGTSIFSAVIEGVLLVLVVLAVLTVVGRRKQRAAKEKAKAIRTGKA